MDIRRVFRREAGWTFAEFAGWRRDGHLLSLLEGGGVGHSPSLQEGGWIDIQRVRRKEARWTFAEFARRRWDGHSPNSQRGGRLKIRRVRRREEG
ncbi:hypothetical protein DPMN_127479 [Dreissena polymorpha]|uniref:Uncharacterized protein n=1 Tax=Dreissena polymorpha TaxID=45954 RepID=A0A9D4H236_DREPO|nr:hypothetical protein DPMN_127479 [Dreissena polymorpha]